MQTPLNRLMLTLALAMSLPAFAFEPADAQIKSAVADLARFEQQVGSGAISKATAQRTLRLLGLARQRLDSSPNHADPSWTDADARYRALESRLQAAVDGSPGPAPSAPPAGPATTRAAPMAAPVPSAAPQMISHQRVRVTKLGRDIQSATDSLDRDGVKPFQDPAYVAKQSTLAQRFEHDLQNYSDFATDPAVTDAHARLTRFRELLAFGTREGEAARAALGDVQARLRVIDGHLANSPRPPAPPYTQADISAWSTASTAALASIDADLKTLADLKARAHLPLTHGTVGQGAAYDFQDVDRIRGAMERTRRQIDESRAQLASNLGAQIEQVERTLDSFDRLNPDDEHDRSNGFLGEGVADERRARLADQRAIVLAAIAQQQAAGGGSHSALLDRVDRTAREYEARHKRALDGMRMPKRASRDDAELQKIARETLANPKYGVGEIRRLVVNTQKTHREKQTSETQYDDVDVSLGGKITLHGTQTTYFYEWDEFQVATAEPVGAKHHVFYNTLKYFTRGASTTPLNRWIVANRFQGNEIPAGNIDRD